MAILRSQIYFVNLNPTAGREQSGTRPVLVLSIDNINRLPPVVDFAVKLCCARNYKKLLNGWHGRIGKNEIRRYFNMLLINMI
jgi:mRNA-degrading endonuclease toxin of MazEF toxin-antitoxin module